MTKQLPADTKQFSLPTEADLLALANRWGPVLAAGAIVYLEGTLGAGKTTFSRGILHGIGHSGAVKSPTYTLVEPYEIGEFKVYHFDLYRLGDPEELEYLGIRDYLENNALWLVEWPVRGAGVIPPADIILKLTPDGLGRQLQVYAPTSHGQTLLYKLK